MPTPTLRTPPRFAATRRCAVASKSATGNSPDHPAHDSRIKAAVVADPLAIFFTAKIVAPITVPVQLWASELGGDGVFLKDVAPLDTTLSAPHEYHIVRNAGHFAFLLCPPALAQAYPDLCTDPNGFDRAAFHKEFNAASVKFLRENLNGRK